MPFLTELDCRFIDGKNQIRLVGLLRYFSKRVNDWFVVDIGFECDCASIPRAVWSITGLTPFDYRIRKEAVLHDYLYRCRGDLSRRLCDKIFYDALNEGYMDNALALACYRAVRIGGGLAREVEETLAEKGCEE